VARRWRHRSVLNQSQMLALSLRVPNQRLPSQQVPSQ
jgi:hypothetical protein